MPGHRPQPRTTSTARRRAAALTVLATLAGLGMAGEASAAPTPGGRHATDVQRSIEQLVREDRFPAALAGVRARNGSSRHYRAGVADIDEDRKPPMDGQVRIGSNTKTFVAVVVLQLVAEGKVDLDAPIETYLPGLLRGDGIDGRRITVRHLLQHTSGLPDYTDFLGADVSSVLDAYVEPRELLDVALAQQTSAVPGARHEYSNTNYIVAGLLVQKVTRRTLAREITERVIDRTGLRHTYFPAAGEQQIRDRHPHGYFLDESGDPLMDVTDLDPSAAWAAGAMVSTPSDLNRFLTALLGGRLLPAAQLAQMRTTVPADGSTRYGLGLTSRPLRCGGISWGHGGSIPGYQTRVAATDDGRAVTIAVTAMAPNRAASDHVAAVVDTALCP